MKPSPLPTIVYRSTKRCWSRSVGERSMFNGATIAVRNVTSAAAEAAIDRREEFLRRLASGEIDAVELWQVVRRAQLPVEVFDQPALRRVLLASGPMMPASIWL